MQKTILTIGLLCLYISSHAQTMRPIEDLINAKEPGWQLVQKWVDSAKNLEWEPMEETYTEFLLFCFSGDLGKFYATYRWKGWRKDMTSLQGDQTFNFYPPLWSKEGKDINKDSRKAVPAEEQYRLNLDTRRQMGIK